MKTTQLLTAKRVRFREVIELLILIILTIILFEAKFGGGDNRDQVWNGTGPFEEHDR